MANKKTDRDGRFQIKANRVLMLAFDIQCKQAGTNRSARIAALMARDILHITADQAATLTGEELAAERDAREQYQEGGAE